MRPFRDVNPGVGPYIQAEGVHIRSTYGYIELEYQTNPYKVVYLVPRSDTSVWVGQSFGDQFTPLARLFAVNQDQDFHRAITRAIPETWPMLSELLENGFAENYSAAALIVLTDPDDETGKWFLTSVLGNIDPNDPLDLFSSRTDAIVQRIDALSVALDTEWRTTSIDKVRLGARIFSSSVSRDIQNHGKYVSEQLIKLFLKGALGS